MAYENGSNRVAAVLADLLKALCVSLAVSAAGFVLLFLAGFAFGTSGGRVPAGLEAAKDGLLLSAALVLFLLAGMILIKGKKEGERPVADTWRNHFQIVGFKSVLAVFCIGLTALAVLADYLLLILF